jgi:hypothetical protein
MDTEKELVNLNQNKMKQTAVEWFAEITAQLGYVSTDVLEQAKEIEKQQIIKAVFDSMGTNLDPNMGRAEQYYNETYKSE